MKKLFFSLILLTAISCGQNSKYPTEFSQEALNQKIYSTDEAQTTIGAVLEQNKGNKIVLDIWASWCGDCVASMPKITKIQEQFPDVKFIMISVDKEEAKWKEGLQKFVVSNGVKAEQYTFNTGWKKGKPNEFIDFIRLDWIPRYMVVSENGKISYFYAKEITDEGLIKVLKN